MSGGRHALEGAIQVVSIKFIEASGAEHEVSAQLGQTVMESAIWNNVPGIDAECGGSMACSTCLVHVGDSWGDQFPSRSTTEAELVSCHPFAMAGSRLSCQLRVVESIDGLILKLPPAQK
jgi:2Fe-2S ferredoxin